MRSAVIAAVIALAALASGCGGDEIAVEEVPGGPPTLSLPLAEDAAPGAVDASADADAGAADEDAQADADTTTGDTGAATAPPSDTGGATVPAPEETVPADPAPEQDPAATGGADADEGLDQFCADNPGAC